VTTWVPTAESVNALPDGLRDYIHALETHCDPAGDVQSLVAQRENNAALAARVVLLETEIERLLSAMEEQFISSEGLIPRYVFRVDDVEEIKA
jgi:hypothetical protein